MTDGQRFVPMLAYEDASRAAEWLVSAFGFREKERFADARGRVTDVVLTLGEHVLLAGSPSTVYQGPRRHAETCDAARAWLDTPYILDGVLVYVDDVAAHLHRAKSAGARILSDLETNPLQRQYRCEDLEGHRWMFAERV
ncbi:MAG TPA: VOC family protein [Candidatus Limnocylindria bacterium]